MYSRRNPIGMMLLAFLSAFAAGRLEAQEPRPLLVTVDDLPIASGRLHPEAAERERITRELLAALAEYEIRAVGFVTWRNVRDATDLRLLELWLEAGHELGNHGDAHLDLTRSDAAIWLADVEAARGKLADFLAKHDTAPRFFRFPFLREGDNAEKLDAARAWLERTGQRNLPVTIDNQDWSFEEPWVTARRAGDERGLREIGADYLAALRIAVRHHERTGDRLFGRQVPQVLLLHANAVGAAHWATLFDWLDRDGHRFVGVDELLADPAFAVEQRFVGPAGFGHWDRLLVAAEETQARDQIAALLDQQAAAWTRGDLDAFCSVYADDATFVSPSGITRGRAEILERYRRRYADRAAMGTLQLEVLETRTARGTEISLLGDARPSRVHGAAVVARWSLSFPDREPATGSTLIVLRRAADGTWLIVQDASM